MKKTVFTKRFLRVCITLFVLIFVFTFAVCAEEIREEIFEWEPWIKDTVLPMIIAFLSASAVNYIENLPLMIKIKKSSERFDKTSENVNSILEKNLEQINILNSERDSLQKTFYEINKMQTKALEEFLKIANNFKGDLEESENRMSLILNEALLCSKKIENMVYLGFTNQNELITNGSARKIAELEERNT